jgi:hypothetical protein
MLALKNVEYITDGKGNKKGVLLPFSDFDKLKEDIEDLQDALAIEKARKEATGFKKWNDFLKEIESPAKGKHALHSHY